MVLGLGARLSEATISIKDRFRLVFRCRGCEKVGFITNTKTRPFLGFPLVVIIYLLLAVWVRGTQCTWTP